MMSKGLVILYTDRGIVALDSPIKLKILELLRGDVKSFEELVNGTGKAKSTVSVHLNDLVRQCLIVEKTHPHDKRKKCFALNSLYVACSLEPVNAHYRDVLDNLARSLDSEFSFLKSLFHAIRYGLEAYGINPNPLLKKIGCDVGSQIAGKFRSSSLPELLEEIKAFWGGTKLGKMTVSQEGSCFCVVVEDCFDCGNMPYVERTLCSLDEGILEGILDTKLGKPHTVKEIECFGTGYHHCRFMIEQQC